MAHLQRHGLKLLRRNFRCRQGEIDAVMSDGAVLVFVEVRFRRNDRYGAGFETVTRIKQRRIITAARAYLARHRAGNATCRFDVVSVTKRNCAPEFMWVRNAFDQVG